MRRHIFFKADVAALDRGRAQRLRVLRAMLPAALLVSLLFGDSVHREILLLGLLGRRRDLRIGLSAAPRGGWTKFASRTRLMLESRSAFGHTEKPCISLWESCVGIITSSSSSSLASLCFGFASSIKPPLSCRAVGVSRWLVDFRARPRTVQKHRKLPGHGHHRPLLRVRVAPAGGHLLSQDLRAKHLLLALLLKMRLF
jgi:hypothetical protein